MKHHTKPKKFLSIALAVLLLLSLYTPLALADDTPITFADLQTWIANEPAGAQALFPNLDFYPPSNPLPTGDDVGNVSLGISVATTPDVDDDGPETYCYEDLELRVSFGTAAPYLDLDAMLVALGASTSVGGTAFNVSLDDSDPDNPYISFKAPRTSEIYVGTLEFPLLLKNGITPNLTNLPLRAEWFYPDSDDSHIMKSLYYADITPALQAGAQLEWGSAATGTTTQPAGGFVIPNINNQDFCPDSGPFVWTVNVQDKIIVKPNSNHQFADTFEIDNTLSFGEGITANLSDIIVTWDDGTQIPATITPNGNSFNIRFSYTPDKADPILNPANFSYKVSLASVHLGTSLPIDDLTRNVTLDASASKVSGVNSESVFVAVAGNQSTYTLKRIKPDESFDPDLAGSLHVNKVMKGHASDYEFEDTDEAVFAIEDIGFGDNNAFTVDNFTITDMAFDSKLVPKIVKLGTYTGGYKPRELLLTINNKIYTYDVSALPANATVDLTAVLSDLNLKDSDGYNPPGGTALKQITKMTLNFGTITQTPGAKFSASVAPQFIFTVTVKEPYNGGTANNYAYMEFLYAKPNHSDVTYSMRDSETIKLRENTIPFIDLNKNAQMSTDAFDPANPGDYTDFKPFDDGEEEPNRYYKYTITLRNYGPPTEGDRVLLDPWIRDTLPTQYLDMTKFKVISVTYPPNPPSNITIALTADDYTSKTDSVSPAKSAILWDFKGTLNPSETITIEYVVKMKSKQQLIADGWTEGDSLEVNNTVESNGYTDIAGVNVRPRYPRPNITLRLNVDINGFTTPPADPSTSKYTLTVHNDENLFDGSIDVDRVRAAAQLPNGFTLKTGSLDDAALKALFSVTHGKIVNSVFTATGAINDILAASTNTYVPDSGYSESGSVRYIYQDYTNTPIYTITLYEKSAGVYDHFVFDMEKNNILPTTSTLGGDNGDALTIVFNANIAPAYSDFTEGYKTSFEADA
ncbi:MAG: hypothetical protein LBN00_06850, partial [Oscillospiraceae bacterium]|nr:hypothetical protein [Oscillospiraceae bacterium]